MKGLNIRMKPYMTYSQMTAFAKKQIKTAAGTLAGAAAILTGANLGLRLLLPSLPHQLFAVSPALWYILNYLISAMATVLLAMLQTGMRCLSLKICSEQPVSVSGIFYAFRYQTKNCILLSVFIWLIDIVPMIPYRAVSSSPLIFSSMDPVLFTVFVLSYIPAVILNTFLRLTYSQAYYLMFDYPSLSLRQLLKSSRLLMRGHKKRYFFIQIRLLLLFLLGSLCTCFIGSLWLMPFTSVVTAKFYLELIRTKRMDNAAE